MLTFIERFCDYSIAILASTIEDETVNNKGKRPPGPRRKSDCLIPLIRLDFSTLGERCTRTIFTRWSRFSHSFPPVYCQFAVDRITGNCGVCSRLPYFSFTPMAKEGEGDGSEQDFVGFPFQHSLVASSLQHKKLDRRSTRGDT